MMDDVRVLPELPSIGGLLARGTAAVLRRRRPEALAARRVEVHDHAQDVERLAAYDRLCGFALRDRVSPTWLHVLAFPLQAWLMARPDFPAPLAGLVHVANDMTVLRPVTVGERLSLGVSAANLQPHRRGVTFDLVSTADVGGERVWRGTSTYLCTLARLRGAPAERDRLPVPDAGPSATWRLPADLGRQYAEVSGDVNPIHLSRIAARAFGFRRPIVHGMWTHARALAALEPRLPDAYRVRVDFARPVLVPTTLTFGAARSGGVASLVVAGRDGRPRLVGEVAPA